MRAGLSIRSGLLAGVVLATLAACGAPAPVESPAPVAPPPGAAAVGECPWEPGTAPEAPASGTLVERVEAVALAADDFWGLVETLPESAEPTDFTAMSTALAGCGLDDVLAFEARLTLALYALDSRTARDRYEQSDPDGPGTVSDDVFLYARADTVLAGRAAWERAVAEHTLERRDAPSRLGEYLLYVSWDAAVALGLTTDEYLDELVARIPLSYESGSNPEGRP